MAVSAAQMLAATGLSALALPVSGTGPAVTVGAVAAVVVPGVFGTGATSYPNFRITADEGATSAATVGYLLPAVSVALGVTQARVRAVSGTG